MAARTGTVIALAVLCLAPHRAFAQLNASTVGTGFSNPVFAASAPGQPGTLYVVQQGGLIRPLNTSTGTVGSTPLLNLGSVSGAGLVSGGERGLLGLAFHPNFQSNGLMYVQYTFDDGPATTGHGIRVEQYTVSAGVADPASRRTVIEYGHPDNTNHNAGWLGFNPRNGTAGGSSGHLYIATGDGGGGNDPGNNAQNRNVLLGKLLRVDVGGGLTAGNPTYAIPAGNMTGANTRAELFSYGLRNPYRAGFDRQTGDLYIGDVGQGAREEVNVIANGAAGGQNFGWRLREGTILTPGGVGGARPPDNVDPVFEYDRSFGQSITGGYVYRGTATDDNGQPLDGSYFFGDFVQGRVFTFRYNGTTATGFTDRTAEFSFPSTPNVSSFAEDGFGSLYLIDYGGTVYRLAPVPEPGLLLLVAAAGAWAVRRRACRPAGRA